MAHKKKEEGEGLWLVSYADMMTLLVGFFVMLMSYAKIDYKKYEQLKKETTKMFGGRYRDPYENLANQLQEKVKDMGLKDQVAFNQTERGVEISFKGGLFFDSGSVTLRDEAEKLLENLMPVIRKQAAGFAIVVEGHTDDQPISGGVLASNWELSSVRACTVTRLFEQQHFDRTRLKAIGWADTRPLLPNEDAKGQPLDANRAANRRVVIKILRDFED